MQNNDMDSCVSGGCGQHCQVGTGDSKGTEQEPERFAGFANTGYRWLKVNNFLYVYTATTLQESGGMNDAPHTEVLAYVQQRGGDSDFIAMKKMKFGGAIGMQIPPGSLSDMILKVEEYILTERSTKTLRE